MKLFGTDGVRGKAGKELNVNLALKLAMAAGIHFRKKSVTNKILIGKDTRRSGYMLENAIVAGLTAVGYDCVQIGPMPTPAIAFLTEDMRCDAGIMISASHNAYYDNGIKFFDNEGNKLNTEIEALIEQLYADEEAIEFGQKKEKEIGSSKRIDDVIGRYIVHIKNSFPKHLSLKGVRIVVDAANGAAYKVAPTIFSELGADLIVINDEPNGFNINEKCGALHPGKLAEEVLKFRADIGFALDGDADRLVVVDEKGNVVDGDKLIAALAIHLKNQNLLKNSAVVATVMSNGALEDFFTSNGIKLFRCNVGDKHVLEVMQKEDLNFGGEQSGHIVFSDYAKTGDGLASALQTMAYVLSTGKPASVALNPFELYPQLQEAINVKTKKPLEEIPGFVQKVADIESKKIRHLIRYSGTENKLRVLLEGKSEAILAKEMESLVDYLKSALNA
ncbi:MAG: phosphoglucosamine mutase [Campylobacteraceae bacterium]|jgi:phosphoglucosamine mutase|nr:phosphoglucosamine mutase [Campylobacteraceae bacterium]